MFFELSKQAHLLNWIKLCNTEYFMRNRILCAVYVLKCVFKAKTKCSLSNFADLRKT